MWLSPKTWSLLAWLGFSCRDSYAGYCGLLVRFVRNRVRFLFFIRTLGVYDHGGTLLIQFNDNQARVDFAGVVVAGRDPVNDSVRKKRPFSSVPRQSTMSFAL